MKMKRRYFIYKINNCQDEKLIVSESELKFYESKLSKLDARKQAIYKILGVVFPDNVSSQEVKKYVSDNIYGTPKWEQYTIFFSDFQNQKIRKELLHIKTLDILFNTEVGENNMTVFSMLKSFILTGVIANSKIIDDVQEVFSL